MGSLLNTNETHWKIHQNGRVRVEDEATCHARSSELSHAASLLRYGGKGKGHLHRNTTAMFKSWKLSNEIMASAFQAR